MASYLRGWLTSQISALPTSTPESNPPTPTIVEREPSIEMEDDDDVDTVKGDDDDDDDVPPSFPALNSAQRIGTGTSTTVPALPRVLTDSELMPPPPPPSLATRRPGIPLSPSNSLGVPQTPGSSLGVTTTTKAPNKKASRKVALAPGHGPLDWANLKKSGQDLRGVDSLMRISMSELKQHNKRDDAWSAFNGKVYNITPYLAYHPGGEKELMRAAGRDGTKLFNLTHAWVNVDYMLDACLVGFLVSDS
ncbi:cytochrome b5-like heme/steroid binding domain-containing protein [Abortiporus biennis]|nr:cytochrome b5-like heme/steroid binding domain-containing protein [Abortiporus biennis]